MKRKIAKAKTATRRFVRIICNGTKGINTIYNFRVTNINQAIRFVEKVKKGQGGFNTPRIAWYIVKSRSTGNEIRKDVIGTSYKGLFSFYR